MNRTWILAAAVVAIAGCNKNAASGGGTGGGSSSTGSGVCASGKVDLSKISGDWIVKDNIAQPEGSFPGNQYRIRFVGTPAADGSIKAMLAWRLDSRSYTGHYYKNALGGVLDLVEDMTDETIAQLRKNQDPGVPMRSAVKIEAADEGCVLSVSDETITYVGDKDIRKTSLGSLKMVPAPAGAKYSFVRCTEQRAVYFDGKADEGGAPVKVAAGTKVTAKLTGSKKDLEDCPSYDGDIYVDGELVAEKFAATVGTEDVPGPKGKVDHVPAVFWEAPITLKVGPPHGVEIHAYGECAGGRKLLAAACNLALTK
ncbi:MAG TPA: hypothetical protein VMV18_03970 [bacterium]|nr:hypothetical protein [bacterium]